MGLAAGLGLMGNGVGMGGITGQWMSYEYMTDTDQCVSIWCVLRADGIKPPFAFAVDLLRW